MIIISGYTTEYAAVTYCVVWDKESIVLKDLFICFNLINLFLIGRFYAHVTAC